MSEGWVTGVARPSWPHGSRRAKTRSSPWGSGTLSSGRRCGTSSWGAASWPRLEGW